MVIYHCKVTISDELNSDCLISHKKAVIEGRYRIQAIFKGYLAESILDVTLVGAFPIISELKLIECTDNTKSNTQVMKNTYHTGILNSVLYSCGKMTF